MPKGALLHAHLDATVNAEFLLELALKQPGMHLRIHKPLVASSLSENLPEFRILPKAQFSDLRSLGDVSYNPGSWVSFQNARKNFPTQLGGQEGFDKWVIGSITINPAEAYGTHNTTAKVCHYALFYLSFLSLGSNYNLQLIIDLEKVHEHISDVYGIFSDFFSSYLWTECVSQGLILVEPIFSEYIREFFRSSIRDGISYIETRINFIYKWVTHVT